MLEFLTPPDIVLNASLLLIFVSAITSFLTAAAGIGGGIALLSIMAIFVPAAVIIPLHGAVQIGSNFGRTALMLPHVDRSIMAPFIFGTILGAALGGVTAVQLPPGVLKIGLACFILWSVWGRAMGAPGRLATIGTGVVSSFLTMFFGATGTFVSAMIKTRKLGRMEHVATHSACMVAQHAIKVMVFGLLGFSFAPYLGLIVAMVTSGFIGTVIGKSFLLKTSDNRFHRVLSFVLTLLSIRLLYEGWVLLGSLN
ncbi:MAG: TSUP family transporter [Rhizobiaceae bacterium]|nr:TSUP family transporter [Rhizobiaceae bacterium]